MSEYDNYNFKIKQEILNDQATLLQLGDEKETNFYTTALAQEYNHFKKDKYYEWATGEEPYAGEYHVHSLVSF